MAGPAAAGDPVTLSSESPSASWSGGGGPAAYLLYRAFGCGGTSPIDSCDATLVTVADPAEGESAGTLTVSMTPSSGPLDDFDLFVYRADAAGEPDGDPIESDPDDTGHGGGVPESVAIPNASGTYLVEIVTFSSIDATFDATASLAGRVAAARSATKSKVRKPRAGKTRKASARKRSARR